MASKVGPKGQVVIEKEIRDRLSIQPGWQAFQFLVGDHVEVYFLPPEDDSSAAGSLTRFTDVRIPGDEELEEAIARSWETMTDEELAERLSLKRPASALFWRRKAIEILSTQEPTGKTRSMRNAEAWTTTAGMNGKH